MIYTRVSKEGDLKKSFTLLEVIVVIIIVGIFAGVLTPLGNIAIRRAKIRKTEEKIEILDKAITAYYESYADFPGALTDLETADYVSESDYSDDYAYDAWRVPFEYTCNLGAISVTIRSFGPDRSSTTEAEKADDILYVVQAKDIWKKWRRDTQERLRKINQAAQRYISKGNTISTGNTSEDLASELDAANIYDPWGEPYYYDDALATFYSLGPDREELGDEVYPAGFDVEQ